MQLDMRTILLTMAWVNVACAAVNVGIGNYGFATLSALCVVVVMFVWQRESNAT